MNDAGISVVGSTTITKCRDYTVRRKERRVAWKHFYSRRERIEIFRKSTLESRLMTFLWVRGSEGRERRVTQNSKSTESFNVQWLVHTIFYFYFGSRIQTKFSSKLSCVSAQIYRILYQYRNKREYYRRCGIKLRLHPNCGTEGKTSHSSYPNCRPSVKFTYS